MSENLKNSLTKETDDFLSGQPSARQKAWSIIHEFYHMLLTHMEKQHITKADLARRLNRSRSSISQLLNKTPNFTVSKMVELADAVGLDFSLVTLQEKAELRSRPKQKYIYVVVEITKNAEQYHDFPVINHSMIKILSDLKMQDISCQDGLYTADARFLN